MLPFLEWRIFLSKIELRHISHSYGDVNVLNDINLDIEDGEFFTLLGPSGCGKTTLLRIIAGFIQCSNGKILMDDKNINSVPPEKRNIGFVFQNYALFPHMSVWENVCFGLNIKKLTKSKTEEIAKKYLDLVNLYDYRNKKISQLSGGQQQRVAVARSLAIEPKVLLLDEPMSNLDVSLREEMREEIRRIQKKLNITAVFVTHDQSEACSISDRIAVFNEGECLQCDTPENIYFNPITDFTANFLGKTNILTKEYLFEKGLDIKKDKVYIRSEMIKLYSKPEHGRIKVKITEKKFYGNITQYICNDGYMNFIVEEFSLLNSRKIGDTVYMQISFAIGD